MTREIGPVHTVEHDDREITATWFDAPFLPLSPRVYGVCIVEHDRIVLARSPEDSRLYLPGGGVELGETSEQALTRELREEISAELLSSTYLGCHRVDDFEHPETPHSDFHLYYSCRVRLDEFVPEIAVCERVLVPADGFLDAIAWSDDPASRIILRRAIQADRAGR